jgi:NRAMP (natural resistance-associated macrophage protein)-like metal ion transporter
MAEQTMVPSPEDSPPITAREVVKKHTRLDLRGMLRAIGPGIITGGADNDPAGIATYSVVGATAGFSMSWLLVLSTPLLIVIQEMSARIGNVLKTDLATAIRTRYGRWVATPAVLFTIGANILTIGADLLMLAAVTELVTGVKYLYFVVPYAVIMAGIIIFTDYKVVSRYLLWLVAVFVTYIVAAFLAKPDWAHVLRETIIPQIKLDPTYLLGAVALLGTTITPYLFFWQASGEVEEKRGVQGMGRTRMDISVGMVWSNITAFFIVTVTAVVLFSHHVQIKTAADAARALEPFAGPQAKYLFAVGIIGAGMLAIPVLAASTAYSVGGLFGWRRGLGRNFHNAPQFYFVVGAAILVGVQLAVAGVNPVQALFYSQVLDGLIAPFLVVLLLLLTSNKKLMGDFVNGTWTKVIGWGAVAVLTVADSALVYTIATQGIPS